MRILIVDPHVLFRQGLQSLLSKETGFEIIDVAASCREAVDKLLILHPDLVLLEVALPDGSGLVCLREIVARRPECNVVMLATQDVDEYLFEALRMGAQGLIVKDTPIAQLVAALRGMELGQMALSRSQVKRVIKEFARLASQPTNQSNVFDDLSRRELEILQHIGSGANNREIASRFAISEHTVKVHVRNIRKKLALQSRAQIASIARQYGL
jgi:DNA-binding NarL/FixJ family response regulator